jgi:F-box/WD-40 domain protein 7
MEQSDESELSCSLRVVSGDCVDCESSDDGGRRRAASTRSDRSADRPLDLIPSDSVSTKKRRIELASAKLPSSSDLCAPHHRHHHHSHHHHHHHPTHSLSCSADAPITSIGADFLECSSSSTDHLPIDPLLPPTTVNGFTDRLSPSLNASDTSLIPTPPFAELLADSICTNHNGSVLEQFASCCNHSSSLPETSAADETRELHDWLLTFQRWTHTERISSLGSLVNSNICDIQEIRYLLSIIEPQLQRDFISLLPKELALYVLNFLEPKDLLRAAQTCRYWRILCEDNLLWREKCREEGLLCDQETLSDIFRRRLRRKSQQSATINAAPTAPSSPTSSSSAVGAHSLCVNAVASISQQHQTVNEPFIRSEYKLAYLRQHAIEYNWRYGRFPNEPAEPQQPLGRQKQPVPPGRLLKDILHLKGHDDHVITCLQFNPQSNLIVSGSDDNTLKVWSSVTGRCLRTLTGHTGGVWSSQLSPDNIVISGSTDRTLKVWNALTGECMHTLYGHTSTVRCMALSGRVVVSGSRDATLRVWDIYTGQCRHVLVGHMAAVRCVQFNGHTVVSGAYDYLVKVWDVRTETCLYTLEGHSNRVYSLQFDGENIVSGSLDTSIKVWSASSGQLKHTLVGHQSLTSGMQLKGNILVSGNADSTVKVWDINTGDCLQTLAGPNKHQSAVTCLQFNASFVITSSDDGTVKLWDLKTGEFIRNLVSLGSGGSGGVVWRIRASNTKLVCAVGSRNGTEDTAIKILNMDPDDEEDEQPLSTLSTPSPLTSLAHGLSALSSVSI